jgi:hypothetical protein
MAPIFPTDPSTRFLLLSKGISSSLYFSSLSFRLPGSFTRIRCQTQSFSILQCQRITINAAPAAQKAGLPFDRRVIDHSLSFPMSLTSLMEIEH